MSAERLQKILARGADLARRQAEEMIREGRVEINGTVATLGDHADPEKDAIRVDGRRFTVTPLVRRTILINKPSAVMSTRNDPQGRPTVLDLLPPRLRTGMFPIGRLDFDTEGLLIMTNDGDLAQRIAHPRHGCAKTYEARVKGRPDKRKIDRLRHGIMLFGKRTQPATIKSRPRPAGPRESVTNSWWTIVLREGRTRQVREMFYRVGHPVGRLRRVAIGPIQTAGLPSGGWRELDETEIARLLEASTPGQDLATKPRSKKASWTRAGSAARSASKRPVGKRDAPSTARGRSPNARDTPSSGDDRRGDSRRRPTRGRDDGPPGRRPGRGRPVRGRDDGPPGRPGRGRPSRGTAESNERGERGRSRSTREERPGRGGAGSGRAPSRPNGSRPGRGPKAGPKTNPKTNTGPKRGGRPSAGSSAGSSRRPGAGGGGRGPKPGGGSGRRPKSGGRKGPGGRGGGGRGTR